MPFKLTLGIVILCGLTSAGCATMFTGSAQQVTVSSQPPGARVFVNGGYTGVTPLALLLKTERDHTITLQHEGYQDTTAPVFREFNPVAVLNLLSVVCWVVDLATGALWRLTPTAVYVTMQPGGMPGGYQPAPGVIWGVPLPGAPAGSVGPPPPPPPTAAPDRASPPPAYSPPPGPPAAYPPAPPVPPAPAPPPPPH